MPRYNRLTSLKVATNTVKTECRPTIEAQEVVASAGSIPNAASNRVITPERTNIRKELHAVHTTIAESDLQNVLVLRQVEAVTVSGVVSAGAPVCLRIVVDEELEAGDEARAAVVTSEPVRLANLDPRETRLREVEANLSARVVQCTAAQLTRKHRSDVTPQLDDVILTVLLHCVQLHVVERCVVVVDAEEAEGVDVRPRVVQASVLLKTLQRTHRGAKALNEPRHRSRKRLNQSKS